MKHELSSQITRQMLVASLRRQLEKKPLSKITVSQIAEDCGINRKTFYYHFEDIYALLKWMLDQEAVEVVKKFDLLIDNREAIQFVMDYVVSNKHIVNSALDSMGREALKRFFFADFMGIVESYIDGVAAKDGISVNEDYKHFVCEFFTEAIAGTILAWCMGSQDDIPNRERTAVYLERVLQSAVPEALRRGNED